MFLKLVQQNINKNRDGQAWPMRVLDRDTGNHTRASNAAVNRRESITFKILIAHKWNLELGDLTSCRASKWVFLTNPTLLHVKRTSNDGTGVWLLMQHLYNFLPVKLERLCVRENIAYVALNKFYDGCCRVCVCEYICDRKDRGEFFVTLNSYINSTGYWQIKRSSYIFSSACMES